MATTLNKVLQDIIQLQNAIIQKIQNINQGQPGYTPIKGVDYWTQEDKSQLVEQISERLLAQEF